MTQPLLSLLLILLADRGEDLLLLSACLHVVQKLTTVYHPQTNLTEKTNHRHWNGWLEGGGEG